MPSSVIKSFAYASPTRALEVVFTSGRRYLYLDVPEQVARGLATARSKGAFFNARIRDGFRYTELGEGEAPEAEDDVWAL